MPDNYLYFVDQEKETAYKVTYEKNSEGQLFIISEMYGNLIISLDRKTVKITVSNHEYILEKVANVPTIPDWVAELFKED